MGLFIQIMTIHTSELIDPKKVTHLDYIRGLLAMNKVTFRSIGKSIGVTHSCVSHVLHGRGKSHRVQQAVAAALCLPFEELWGDKVSFTRKLKVPQ